MATSIILQFIVRYWLLHYKYHNCFHGVTVKDYICLLFQLFPQVWLSLSRCCFWYH